MMTETTIGVVMPYANPTDELNKKIEELYHFIEMTEALTYDQATAKRIRTFLTQEGIWPEQSKQQGVN